MRRNPRRSAQREKGRCRFNSIVQQARAGRRGPRGGETSPNSLLLALRLLQYDSNSGQQSYRCNTQRRAYAQHCRVDSAPTEPSSYASASYRFDLRNEYVADAALGLDETRRARIGLQLASQP